MKLSPTLSNRFELKVKAGGKCPLEWAGCVTNGGYGQISVAAGKSRGAHVVAWFLCYGYWPEAILHSCDNRRCVTIEHLSEGSKGDNNRDTAAKRRFHYAENHHNGKLTDTQVREIRKRRRQGERGVDIAHEFGVSQSLVSQIYLNKVRLSP